MQFGLRVGLRVRSACVLAKDEPAGRQARRELPLPEARVVWAEVGSVEPGPERERGLETEQEPNRTRCAAAKAKVLAAKAQRVHGVPRTVDES